MYKLKVENNQLGFSLLELMVVVAVIAILVTIALPNYADYTRRARIAEVTAELADTAIKLDQYFLDNRTFVSFSSCPANTVTFTYACNTFASSFGLVATGVGQMTSFNYQLNEQNVRSSATPWGNNAACWVRAKGGKC